MSRRGPPFVHDFQCDRRNSPISAIAFRASGTYHVLALSGAQVALVAGLIVGGLRWLRVGPGPEAVLTSVAVWFYALLVGGDVPIVRAALMASAVLGGRRSAEGDQKEKWRVTRLH